MEVKFYYNGKHLDTVETNILPKEKSRMRIDGYIFVVGSTEFVVSQGRLTAEIGVWNKTKTPKR